MFNFWGKVKRSFGRGKKLGFPTANINLSKKIPEGIYISRTKVENVWRPSLTFIGTAKTFNETEYKAETYFLDFNQNLYGKWISVELIKRIRGNKKFNSAEDLTMQMKLDEQKARKYFK